MENMEDKKEKKKGIGNFKFFQKLKSIKHFEIIIAVILGAVALLIYFSTFKSSSSSKTSYEATSTTEYATMIESKLANVIKQINGVGNVSVMVTLESGPQYIYATTDEEKVNKNEGSGTTTTSTTTSHEPIIVANDIVVVKEIMPTIGGIVVVASGADNTKVKLDIIKAIQALIDVPQSKIEVLNGK